MSDHRVRLDDEELELVVSSLRARAAGLGPKRKLQVLRLAARLDIGTPGNPDWELGPPIVHATPTPAVD